MSTKTTFKRIALVAVAALGLGVLSVAPSQAAVSGLTVTVADGTSSYTKSDSTTAATVNITGLLEAADSVTVQVVTKSVPSGSVPAIQLMNLDSSTSTLTAYKVESITAVSGSISPTIPSASASLDTPTARNFAVLETVTATGNIIRISKQTSAANINHTFGLQLDSTTARLAGTYTYTVLIKAWNASSSLSNIDQPDTSIVKDVNIVVAKAASLGTTPVALNSFANLNSSAAASQAAVGDDSAISSVATAGTKAGYIYVGNRNDANGTTAALDSLTATVTGAGVVCAGDLSATPTTGTCGKSIKVAATGDYQFIVQADGTAGTSSITVSSSVAGWSSTKSLSFYAKAAKTLTASVFTPTLAVGSNDSAVAVTAVDANGINWTGTAYIVASSAADALVGGSATTPVACVLSNDKTVQYCPVSTISTGTAKFKVIDASTVALATATSNEVTVTVSNASAATVKVAFDKATYAPFEKAIITVTPLDASGNKIAAATGNYLAAALTSNVALTIAGGATATLPGPSITTVAYDGTDKTAGSLSYVVYMPAAAGTVTLSGKGGTALPLAGQVALTASANVVNSSVDAATDAANEATDAANAATDAALAAADAADAATAAAQDASDAVAALSASVEKLVASLKAQITSLTNLVIKIQKKVKA